MTLNSWMEKYITCKGFLKVELFSLAFSLHLGQSISTIKYITVSVLARKPTFVSYKIHRIES